jgi:hypothetical protein
MTISVCRIKKVKKPAIIVAPIIFSIRTISSFSAKAMVMLPFGNPHALIDSLMSLGVTKLKNCATIVVTIPSKKLYLYLMKYLFKYCNSFILLNAVATNKMFCC